MKGKEDDMGCTTVRRCLRELSAVLEKYGIEIVGTPGMGLMIQALPKNLDLINEVCLNQRINGEGLAVHTLKGKGVEVEIDQRFARFLRF